MSANPVFTEHEAHSRFEIGQTELAQNVVALKAAGIAADASGLETVSAHITALRAGLAELTSAIGHDHPTDGLEAATFMRDSAMTAMTAVRTAADTLETLVADDLWPLPGAARPPWGMTCWVRKTGRRSDTRSA